MSNTSAKGDMQMNAIPDSIRRLAGGNGSTSLAFGPCIVEKGYYTTANGWADTIAAGPGEVAVRISVGSPSCFAPSCFATWRVGPIADMITYLRSRAGDWRWSEEDLRWANGMAAKIESHVNDQAPVARLAHALGVPVERVAQMATLAKVEIKDEESADAKSLALVGESQCT